MTPTQHGSQTFSSTPAQVDDHHAPAHHLPKVPTVAWSSAGCRRRTWISRTVLLTILAFQAALSLRLSNTAFQDEALYLTAGRAEVSHLLHGTAVQTNYAAYFSGSPRLYPVLAAVVDSRFGLSGARMLSLFFMLGTTALLYSFTRRLFSERAGLAAAGLFSVVQSTIVMGHLATYDAPAVFLLASATWIVVRTAGMSAPSVLLAAPVAVLAVGVKYAAALYLPTIVALALLTALPHRRRSAFLRALLLVLGMSALLVLGMYSTDLSAGVRQTTTNREHGSDGAMFLLEQSIAWGGPLFLAAVAGGISYARRYRLHESPLAPGSSGPGRVQRSLLGALMCATALLAPAYQMHLGTVVALFKHVGFGLLFAAPMAGVGVTRLVGAHFRHTHLGIALWSATLCIGISQADWRFASWPDSSTMIRTISSHVNRKGHYLSSTPEVPVYYLRDRTAHRQWQSVFGMEYTDGHGVRHTGTDAYWKALRNGEFDLVVLDGFTNPRVNGVITDALKGNPHYRLLAALPFHSASNDVRSHLLRTVPFVEHNGHYRIWLKR
ncbi:glycosyltransferase family 39 protein [Streptomyces sp. NBC_00568]|uniref:ArnT family glycosyltransferase n=1 Tax=Streptomyces sp. NBC_00568 TaxID=2975779 RepID=UPI002252E1AD|nr:glycosyltransferase family 39 protein [Streptomyces sp. NBC_00568]MCX4990274.1 glycosyltransferase family 39 protein [Streptomyces sp. NBC_00568]